MFFSQARLRKTIFAEIIHTKSVYYLSQGFKSLICLVLIASLISHCGRANPAGPEDSGNSSTTGPITVPSNQSVDYAPESIPVGSIFQDSEISWYKIVSASQAELHSSIFEGTYMGTYVSTEQWKYTKTAKNTATLVFSNAAPGLTSSNHLTIAITMVTTYNLNFTAKNEGVYQYTSVFTDYENGTSENTKSSGKFVLK